MRSPPARALAAHVAAGTLPPQAAAAPQLIFQSAAGRPAHGPPHGDSLARHPRQGPVCGRKLRGMPVSASFETPYSAPACLQPLALVGAG